MIDLNALSKVTYGLYIVSSGNKENGNGFISNTVFQVSSQPVKFAACCNKDNFTSSLIEKYGYFSASVLQQDTDSGIFGTFGYKSGKDFDKLDGMKVKYGETGTPIILNDSIAYLECKVVEKVDVGTHWIFIGELVDAQILDETTEPITYAYYQKIKKGVAPKNAPTYIDKSKLENKTGQDKPDIYKCIVCGHIYDEGKEEVKFNELPDDWTCPTCGADKEDFIKL